MVRQFPTEQEMDLLYDKIPADRLYLTAYSGLFRQSVSCSEGNSEMLVYLPNDAPHSRPGIMLLLPDGADPEAFLSVSGWIELAEAEKLILFAVTPLESWAEESRNLALVSYVRDLIIERSHYNIGKPLRYLVSYQGANAVAEQLVLTSPECLAGFALVGQVGLDEAQLQTLGAGNSVIPGVPMAKLSIPFALFTDAVSPENQAAIRFFIRANHLESAPYTRDGVQYYLPDRIYDDNWVQSENVAPIAVCENKALQYDDRKLPGRIWRELKKYYRNLDYGNQSTHVMRTMAEMGMTEHSCKFEGYTRKWLVYAPEHREGTRPLILSLHGGSCSQELGMWMSGWERTAKARGVYLAAPQSALRRLKGSMPHPAWNADGKSAAQDDFHFLLYVVEEVCRRYPIDRSRIYITGHSMGSAMTQQMILHYPELFAAAASNSGVIRGGFFGEMKAAEGKEHYKVPVMIQMGQRDIGGGTFEENADAKSTVAHWVHQNQTTGIDAPMEYSCGPFHHKVYQNKDGVPLVDYIVTDYKPHAVTAQDGLMYYDEFFCKFSRGRDGRLFYMGRPID